MRKKATGLLATSIIAGILFLTSCSSPEKEGAKLGKSFTDCLGNTGTYKQSSVLLDKKEDCGKKIHSEWEQAKEKYKNDAGKWKVFVDAYLNATQTTVDELNLNVSKLISTELSGKLWVRADDSSKDFYIFSFENGVLKFLNCNGTFDYQIKGNVISFNSTSGTVTIKDGKLTLSDPQNNVSLLYRQADDKDKVVGKWNVSGSMVVTLERNGGCILGGSGFSTKTTSYTFNDDVLDIKGAGAYKIKTTDWNTLPWGQQPFHRIKIDQPDDLGILFGHIHSTERASSGSSSSSGSENWEQMLDDYERYVDEYLKFYKKAMKGDMSAMSEYPEMMEKATALEESMKAAQNDNKLSVAQIGRLIKIQTKMLQAVTN